LEFLKTGDIQIKAVAILCLGHIARIHRTIDWPLVKPLLISLLDDDKLSGSASDTLDDIAIFVADS
jgi:hypothetical protein